VTCQEIIIFDNKQSWQKAHNESPMKYEKWDRTAVPGFRKRSFFPEKSFFKLTPLFHCDIQKTD
jgi:hypothetical protein